MGSINLININLSSGCCSLLQPCPLRIICCRYKKMKNVLGKTERMDNTTRLEQTLLKLVQKKSHLQNLNSSSLPQKLESYATISKVHTRQPRKQLHRQIIAREKMLSEVLLRELQDVIDSGQVEGLENLHVNFNGVVMKGKSTCFVSWDSYGLQTDLDIQQTLQSASSRIRHVIMHSHVLGIVPKFKFCVSDTVAKQEEAYQILNSENFDMGPVQETSVKTEAEEKSSQKEEKPPKGIEAGSHDPTFELFNVDNDLLKKKIHALMSANRTKDSAPSTDCPSSIYKSEANRKNSMNKGLFKG